MRTFRTAIALAAASSLLAACATTLGDAEVEKRTQAAFDQAFANSGRPDMVARLAQDEVQQVCTHYRNDPPKETAERLERSQMAAIQYPARLMGDWRQGEKIAQDGYGLRFTDTDAKRPNGGNCYDCHRLAPQELSYGTLGPSLYQFGKQRGAGLEVQRYTYGKIFNPQAYTACSNMPRFGHNHVLTPEQITHLVALLLDPNSPVNK
jgi:sulfur-oxidizing protein SoxX